MPQTHGLLKRDPFKDDSGFLDGHGGLGGRKRRRVETGDEKLQQSPVITNSSDTSYQVFNLKFLFDQIQNTAEKTGKYSRRWRSFCGISVKTENAKTRKTKTWILEVRYASLRKI